MSFYYRSVRDAKRAGRQVKPITVLKCKEDVSTGLFRQVTYPLRLLVGTLGGIMIEFSHGQNFITSFVSV